MESLNKIKLMWIISILIFVISILNYFFNLMGIVQWLILDIINLTLVFLLLLSRKRKNKFLLTAILLIMMFIIIIKDYFLIQSMNSMFEGG